MAFKTINIGGLTFDVDIPEVANDFNGGVNKALSAEQGKVLKQLIDGAGGGSSVTDFDTLDYTAADLCSIFGTAMNYMLKTETINGVENIGISDDLGKTWNYIQNTIGGITNWHIFCDGTVMLCTATKVYWTKDYSTLTESTVLDYDGTAFSPASGELHFHNMNNNQHLQFLDGKEMYVWGDYLLTSTHGTPRIWYTTDKGRTIKCAAKFGTTPMNGNNPISIRHVHKVELHPTNGYFYITTGDSGDSQCCILRARYNASQDTWAFELLAQGVEFKMDQIVFAEGNSYVYFVTDYTDNDAKPKGVLRVAIDDLGTEMSAYTDKFQYVFKSNKPWTRLVIDNHGHKVLIPDYQGRGEIWCAKSGWDFHKVSLPSQYSGVFVNHLIGPNYDGDIYVMMMPSNMSSSGLLLNYEGIYMNLSAALRRSGWVDWYDNAGI